MNDSNQFSSSRRKLLVRGAGVLALGIFGAAAWRPLTQYRAAWVERVVRDSLPGIQLDPESMKNFVNYVLTVERMQPANPFTHAPEPVTPG